MLQVLRTEKKYAITLDEYYHVKDKLRKLLAEDPHNGKDGYLIRSLYFDTFDDTDYEEKLAGVETRRKVRLRCYGSNDNRAKLELKQKQGDLQLKRSLSLSRSDAQALAAGCYDVLLTKKEPLALECYGLMQTRFYRPKVIIEYKRTAFIARENDIRITLDKDVVSTQACLDLFAEELQVCPVMEPFNVVMEVKYNGFLPSYIKDIICMVNASSVSIGKYALGR